VGRGGGPPAVCEIDLDRVDGALHIGRKVSGRADECKSSIADLQRGYGESLDEFYVRQVE